MRRGSSSPAPIPAGLRVLVWTVNDPPEAERLLAAGADGIITDNLRQFASRFPELL